VRLSGRWRLQILHLLPRPRCSLSHSLVLWSGPRLLRLADRRLNLNLNRLPALGLPHHGTRLSLMSQYRPRQPQPPLRREAAGGRLCSSSLVCW